MEGPIGDELFARIAVKKGLTSLGSLRECLDILRAEAPSERQPLSTIMLRQGVLSRQEVELLEKAVRAGSVTDERIGRYELLADIGEGGMGAVHAAVDVWTFELCALKTLPKELAEEEDIVKRFLQEAETACTLRHPNIVGGLAVGKHEGLHFFSMEFVDGETVYERLEREAVLPEGECLRIARGISLGLQYASEHGLVHRDMKPENIMIDRDGTPKLLDMGLVKRTDATRVTRLTQDGMAIGTPHYISPEQARGEKRVDIRSDIYALGATLYHMVTGQVPFEGNTAAVIMTKHLTEELDWPSDVNPEVSEHASRLISRMMAKEREDRYARPKDVVADIDLILTGRAPSGDMLPPGVSSIRGAVKIARARDKAAARAGATAVYERMEKRSRGGWTSLLKGHRKALIWTAGILAALNVLFLVLLLSVGPGPEDEPEPPPVVDDDAARRMEEAIKVEKARAEAAARLDAEAARRLKEVLDRVEADPGSLSAAVAELRRLRERYAASRVARQIDEEIARLLARRPAAPAMEPVNLVKEDSLQGWDSRGKWKAKGRSFFFEYDDQRKYSRSIRSSFGFGEFSLAAEIKSEGGTRAEIAVWEQTIEDRRKGAPASSVVAIASGEDLDPAQGKWAKLKVRADPSGVAISLGRRRLDVLREGKLRNGRLRFSLSGGQWTIQKLEVAPVLADGVFAYEVGFAGGKSHGWKGTAAEDGLRATPRHRRWGGVWAEINSSGGRSVAPLFTVTAKMRLAVVFRVNRVFDLKMRLDAPGPRSYAFRLSGRAPERRWTALTVPLTDFRQSSVPGTAQAGGEGYKPPPAGTPITGLAIGAEGERPELTVSLVRVIR